MLFFIGADTEYIYKTTILMLWFFAFLLFYFCWPTDNFSSEQIMFSTKDVYHSKIFKSKSLINTVTCVKFVDSFLLAGKS